MSDDPKTTEADGGPIIFVRQPEFTDGWTADEVASFRAFLARIAAGYRAGDRCDEDERGEP